jgi:cell division protein FtsI (penicillin-binding protein 3)
MHLNDKLDIELPGEGTPRIKLPTDSDWSGLSLPWMSIGYECTMTPLQILTFYNAVANEGKMVKPRFVKEIRKRGKTIKEFPTVVIDEHICSKETIKKAKEMLEGVVKEGTASNLKHANYGIAGKTGTAQISNTKYGYKYESKVSYQASFVGYFPAENPKYSCIVVVNAPSNNVYYGNLVAGPIFKAVSDKVFSTSLDLHPRINDGVMVQNKKVPYSKNGFSDDLMSVFNQMNVNSKKKSESEWVTTQANENQVIVNGKTIQSTLVPDVKGMGARDATYLLESMGCLVKISGKGSVKYQSIAAGTLIKKGMIINLELS